MEGKSAEHFSSKRESRDEKEELLQKRLPYLYLALLELHERGYESTGRENISKRVLSPREKNFLKEKVKEFEKEGKLSITFKFFKIIISSGEECAFSDNRLSLKKLCCLIHFGRYKDNSVILETLQEVGKQNGFSLTKLKDDLYRLEFQD